MSGDGQPRPRWRGSTCSSSSMRNGIGATRPAAGVLLRRALVWIAAMTTICYRASKSPRCSQAGAASASSSSCLLVFLADGADPGRDQGITRRARSPPGVGPLASPPIAGRLHRVRHRHHLMLFIYWGWDTGPVAIFTVEGRPRISRPRRRAAPHPVHGQSCLSLTFS